MSGHHPSRGVLMGFCAAGALLLAVGVLLWVETPALRIAGVGVAVVVIVAWLLSSILEARSSERHSEQHPQLLRNEAIGRTVTALSAFTRVNGTAVGTVELNGEKWKASCRGAGPLPTAGQALLVYGRTGLTLLVSAGAGNEG